MSIQEKKPTHKKKAVGMWADTDLTNSERADMQLAVEQVLDEQDILFTNMTNRYGLAI